MGIIVHSDLLYQKIGLITRFSNRKKASEEAKIQQNAHVHQNFITTDRLKAGSAGEATTSDWIMMRLGFMPYFCVSSP